MIAIPLILLVIAVAVGVVAAAAWTAHLPGNNYIGIRAPEARRSRENWDITHRVAGPPWAVAAVAFAAAAALAGQAIDPAASGWMWLWVAVAALAGIAMLGVGSAMGAHTIAIYQARRDAAERDSGDCCSSGGCADAPGGHDHDHGHGRGGGVCGDGRECGSCDGCDAPADGIDREALRRAARRPTPDPAPRPEAG
ncbi:SdpI family protein [Corynebacterium sphenisci]|uniref:SdpI family protein n=1 Tax=Corynebacterium sphenisci TaxID=191493 RepID=UPI000951C553|nr:SdpI family protein [Corynebacterium sphenisci]